ncbi:MAG TPA: bifunctional phosphopantothenoylcysteine decarboxylase/phosphopantothenate--cysteine ligase CoaBC [Nitrospinae bacterium]|nr:bifunctional phosphopantothenoylcysteine decarboxylase/phosphopantothenate--cysteine ligase CoaBC [Nitrospinota bacterium]HBA26918.1 bifunctional phosphopantothenoylcysteine decarboxylase/phosphopantothenate--cysteine ligase CoaBC [Nitrospinota bacterium]
MNELKGKTIILGVCGGIAAYKSAELIRLFKKDGAEVWVVMTKSAKEFVSPLTFETLSGNPVYSDMFLDSSILNIQSSISMPHIDLGKRCDLFIVAPATANIIGKFANGIADDLLSTLYLSVTSPVLIAPAMNNNMYANPVVQENIKKLKGFNINFVEPGFGELACGDKGEGRLADLDVILSRAKGFLSAKKDLNDKTVLVTAGPTHEPIDPVRFISNLSSGKMGYAVASAARRRGANVILISGPTSLPVPSGVRFISIKSASDMRREILKEVKKADVIIMTAAVSDFTPENYSEKKIKKEDIEGITVKLKKNPDILSEITSKLRNTQSAIRNPIIVGFALETDGIIKNAKKKLKEKNLDFIVANSVNGFGGDQNKVAIIDRKGNLYDIPKMSKDDIAEIILDKIGAKT